MNCTLKKTFKELPVLVTGHTGFKGSWLSIWLNELGAKVIGYSQDPPTEPNNFKVSNLQKHMIDIRGDVRDLTSIIQTIEKHQPQVVFHLAAQAIVLESYKEPKETFDTNIGGTVNILEAIRKTQCVKSLVCITSDKCYENQDWVWGYRENDLLGGHDPYSASKAGAEISIQAYRRSFFPANGPVAIASARAGNVIGGGDWALHRLVPDCMRALMAGGPIHLRNPHHVRPWQHVFESLSGYLLLASKLLKADGHRFTGAWNFGPLQFQTIPTEALVKKILQLWEGGSYTTGSTQSEVETTLLQLNWDKAANHLNWRPVYTAEKALAATIEWYKAYHKEIIDSQPVNMYDTCVEQIRVYTEEASRLGLEWAE